MFATGWKAEETFFYPQKGTYILLLFRAVRLALRSTQPSMQRVSVGCFSGIKRSGHKADYHHQSPYLIRQPKYLLRNIVEYSLTTVEVETQQYRGAVKSLARPARKQANVSVRMAWISFGALPCRKRNLMTARFSMLLRSRASLTCFRACFLAGRAKDLSAPRYILCVLFCHTSLSVIQKYSLLHNNAFVDNLFRWQQ